MSGSPGKVPDGQPMLMRLSVPAVGGLRSVASELATKIAEYLGTALPDVESVGITLDGLASRVAGGESGDITFEFQEVGRELVILAHCDDRSSEVRYPLST